MSRILASAICYPVSVARYLLDAFKELGHTVVTCGPCTGQFIPWGGGMKIAEQYAWTPDIPTDPHRGYALIDVLPEAERRAGGKIDLYLSTDPHFALMGDAPCPVACFGVDNHVRPYDLREYDFFFGAHSWGAQMQRDYACWLPCAYAPRWHSDLGRERWADVGFCGVFYQQRADALFALMQQGFGVYAAQGKVYGEANEHYNASKLALVVSAKNDLACRVFEGMAQGCLVLMDRVPDADRIGLIDGVHYLGFDAGDMAGMERAARRGLDAAERGRITAAAKEWVGPHTWARRAATILREVGLE